MKRGYKTNYKKANNAAKRKKYLTMNRRYKSPAMRNLRTGGFLGIETKFYDTSVYATSVSIATDASGGEADPTTVNCISAPAQGDTEQNRDGNRIMIKSAFVTGCVIQPSQANQTSADNPTAVCVYLVLDKQSNGAQLNSEDVFKNQMGQIIGNASPLRNLQYSSRFQVLAKRVLQLEQPPMAYDGTNIEQGGSQKLFTLSWKGQLPVQFQGGATSAGVSGVLDNSLHVIAFANHTVAPTISYNARIRFVG